MTNEEDYIKKRIGQKNPFKTPEGYFDHFADQLMSKLPEKEVKTSRIYRMRPWLYAAVLVGIIALSATLLFNNTPQPEISNNKVIAQQLEKGSKVTSDEVSNNTYIEDAANYAMIDNEEIYAYLADY